MKKIYSKGEIQTIATELLAHISVKTPRATVVALSGDLGAGKTTLSQEIARTLVITENVSSPTFVIMKRYDIKSVLYQWDTLIHIDAYRLKASVELFRLGFQDILDNPSNLVLIEWPENVPECIPSNAFNVVLSHVSDDERDIDISTKE